MVPSSTAKGTRQQAYILRPERIGIVITPALSLLSEVTRPVPFVFQRWQIVGRSEVLGKIECSTAELSRPAAHFSIAFFRPYYFEAVIDPELYCPPVGVKRKHPCAKIDGEFSPTLCDVSLTADVAFLAVHAVGVERKLVDQV